MLRVTGRVVRVDAKSGVKNPGTDEARAWAFDVIKVLVAEQAIVEVTRFADNAECRKPSVGEEVDYAVEVSVRGGRQNVVLDKPWLALFPDNGLQAVGA